MSGATGVVGTKTIKNEKIAGIHKAEKGDTVVIWGDKDPCGTCQAQMKRAYEETGVDYVYMWGNRTAGQSGGAVPDGWWQASNPLG
jgi:hypothetical protein